MVWCQYCRCSFEGPQPQRWHGGWHWKMESNTYASRPEVEHNFFQTPISVHHKLCNFSLLVLMKSSVSRATLLGLLVWACLFLPKRSWRTLAACTLFQPSARYRDIWMLHLVKKISNNLSLLFHQGIHGVQHPVFLSVPCVLGENGITDVIQQTLTEGERNQLQKSAATLNEVQSNLVL